MSNTFGTIFRLTTFGESHGSAIGGILDGIPAGIPIDTKAMNAAMLRRRPGQSAITTTRNESDNVEILSGVFEGKTTGTPIGLLIRNNDCRTSDYEPIRDIFRPSHADFTYQAKYGLRDYRGGGRASARETAVRVAAGEIARQAMRVLCPDISIIAWTASIGEITANLISQTPSLELVECSIVRCPDPEASLHMEKAIGNARKDGQTLGGVVECCISGCPAGLGEPIFNKLHAQLAFAMMSIPAAKGFDYGDGFAALNRPGSEWADEFVVSDDRISTLTNHSGGIQGGISNGMPIRFRIGFKPIATMMRPTSTIDINGNKVEFTPKGRHDICVVPRAVPVVEAMAWMVVLDNWLLGKLSRID